MAIPPILSSQTSPPPQVRLLKNPEIRLIDFGSTTFDHEHHSSIVQVGAGAGVQGAVVQRSRVQGCRGEQRCRGAEEQGAGMPGSRGVGVQKYRVHV